MVILRSLRMRLTLWYVLLLAITLGLFSAGVYFALRQNLYRNLDDSLEGRAEIVAGLVTADRGFDTRGLDIPGDPVEGEEFTRIYDSSGDVVFDNTAERFPVPDDADSVRDALAGSTTRHHLEAGPVDLRVMTTPISNSSEIVGAVQVGLSEDDVHETLRILVIIIALGYPLTLAVASAGGVFLAGRALSPIDALTQTARRISAEDLSRRLEIELPNDEVGRLARTFDEMIARLDEAFRRQRQFTADASHELRTPLTAIKGQTEVALQRERDAGEYRAVLHTINSEVDRMIRLVGSLLTLARADAGQIPLVREPVSAGDAITAAVEHIRASAEEKGVSVNVQGGPDVAVSADEDLLLQLWLNLLDNAVKYTREGGSVTVRWGRDGQHAYVSVADTGVGIQQEHIARVFDRFYRVDPARSRTEGSAGLGLSISRWIADAHGGSIEVESSPESGSTFTVRLPVS